VGPKNQTQLCVLFINVTIAKKGIYIWGAGIEPAYFAKQIAKKKNSIPQNVTVLHSKALPLTEFAPKKKPTMKNMQIKIWQMKMYK
jgi:hypothetical protein